ncbi:MAG: acyl-ACP--UDP-N-acetylglucosamine O-acyltransferase [Phycisphaerae bacterium]|nr:acyl-ACP--UDP-N-acetylglucosamine O-acyltransferase [Phycisphaerae bacterium]
MAAMPSIDDSVKLEGDVRLADDVQIGPGCHLNGPITIGSGTRLIGNVWLQGPLWIGSDNIIYPGAILGMSPQDVSFDPSTPGAGLRIGDRNTIREGVTIHRASNERLPTTIGDDNYFMANSHAGHDAQVGNNCTFVNGCMLGGHVHIEDRVLIGGNGGVHQFAKIGRGGMIAGLCGITGNLCPWFTATSFNYAGSINIVGLRRSGATSDQVATVKWVFSLVCRSNRTVSDILQELRKRQDDELVKEYIDFIETSDRPLIRQRGRVTSKRQKTTEEMAGE